MNSVEIIRAGKNDAQLLSDLSNATFIETYRGTCTDEDIVQFLDKNFTEEIIFEELQHEEELYFIAFANGFPAGYIRLKENNKAYPFLAKHKAIEVKRIYVLKEFHSKKIGAALMNYALQSAVENSCNAVWLGVWEHNEKAKSFYKKFNFKATGFTTAFKVGNTVQTDNLMMKVIEKN